MVQSNEEGVPGAGNAGTQVWRSGGLSPIRESWWQRWLCEKCGGQTAGPKPSHGEV